MAYSKFYVTFSEMALLQILWDASRPLNRQEIMAKAYENPEEPLFARTSFHLLANELHKKGLLVPVDNMGIVNEDYAQNPNYYDTLSAVQEGHVYSQVGFNYYWTNQELAVVNSYYVASVLYPEAFEGVDFEARADEIFNTMLGSDFLDVLEENGMYFGPVTIGG